MRGRGGGPPEYSCLAFSSKVLRCLWKRAVSPSSDLILLLPLGNAPLPISNLPFVCEKKRDEHWSFLGRWSRESQEVELEQVPGVDARLECRS